MACLPENFKMSCALSNSMNLLQKLTDDMHAASVGLKRLLLSCQSRVREVKHEEREANIVDITSDQLLGRAELLNGLRKIGSKDKPCLNTD